MFIRRVLPLCRSNLTLSIYPFAYCIILKKGGGGGGDGGCGSDGGGDGGGGACRRCGREID